MSFLKFVINRRTLVSMLFLGLSLLGAISYRQLPLEMMPEIEFPSLIVQVTSTVEMNPEYFEKQAVIPLEGAIGTLEGVSEIESNIRQRRGTIYTYFNTGVNIDYEYIKLQEKINQIITSIPEEFTVRLVKIDTEQLSNMFMRLQVRGSGGLERVRTVIENDIIDEFESIDGISHVEVTGGQIKALEILIDPDAAEAYNITPSQIRNMLRRNNLQKTFVGHAYGNNNHYFVNLKAEYDDVKRLENIVVDTRGPIYLKDIAEITFGSKEETTLSRVNGKDAVIVQLIKDTDTNLIELSHVAREVIDRLNSELKVQDIEIVIQTNTAEEMERNINLRLVNSGSRWMFSAMSDIWSKRSLGTSAWCIRLVATIGSEQATDLNLPLMASSPRSPPLATPNWPPPSLRPAGATPLSSEPCPQHWGFCRVGCCGLLTPWLAPSMQQALAATSSSCWEATGQRAMRPWLGRWAMR